VPFIIHIPGVTDREPETIASAAGQVDVVTRIFRINMIIRDKAAVSQHRKWGPLSGKQIIAELRKKKRNKS
jgi:phosphoglycerol transferase MdoB-like AlkP superfamily enzyme